MVGNRASERSREDQDPGALDRRSLGGPWNQHQSVLLFEQQQSSSRRQAMARSDVFRYDQAARRVDGNFLWHAAIILNHDTAASDARFNGVRDASRRCAG
jgi:hypothetical protein